RMTEGPAKRDAFMRAMHDEKGIKCVVQYIPLNRYDYYKKLGLGEADCPSGDLFFDTMVSFPFQLWMSDEDFSYMTVAARDVLESLRA
ncbi:MAG: DegT/DnrJ/EryC1/StrS family aminotransferase, partial [Desulfovibrio sp.]|nr:DegT/DnrJ/EryC1/StrS family aminotransferase [Desulfovibrio sp.]